MPPPLRDHSNPRIQPLGEISRSRVVTEVLEILLLILERSFDA